jgi:HlyD family secretion protein
MKNFFNKIKTYVSSHKTISIIVLIIILIIGYSMYKKMTNTSAETRYVLSLVAKGTIISLVSGSGQVSASNQINITPSVSGTITGVYVSPGDQVRLGQTLFAIDSTTAQKAVRDAQISLQSAQLSLQKLQIQNSTENTDATLAKAYSDGFSAVSSTFLDLPSTITGINNLLAQSNLSDNAARSSGNLAINYKNTAETDYYNVNNAYQINKKDFDSVSYSSKQSDIDAIIKETYSTTTLLATAIKDLSDYVNYLASDTGRPADFTSDQTTLSGYTNATNGHLSTLLTAETNIKSAEDTLPNNNIDLQSAEITVTERQNALTDAEQNLADYSVRAPFGGVVASVPVQKGDNAGSGTTLGTIITPQQVAVMSLNEVDVAKISLGQKATLTFDAIPDLTISGKVVQIDSLGTVSQGVVNYNVKINFDTNDSRIKSGMSVSGDIITNVKQDVLIVPNSAVKTANGTSFVQMFDTPLATPIAGVQGSPSLSPPINQTVEIGISDDTNTEIVSGLKEGDQIVVKTIIGTTTTTSSAPSILNSVSGNRGGAAAGAGAARALGR